MTTRRHHRNSTKELGNWKNKGSGEEKARNSGPHTWTAPTQTTTTWTLPHPGPPQFFLGLALPQTASTRTAPTRTALTLDRPTFSQGQPTVPCFCAVLLCFCFVLRFVLCLCAFALCCAFVLCCVPCGVLGFKVRQSETSVENLNRIPNVFWTQTRKTSNCKKFLECKKFIVLKKTFLG